MKKFNHFLVTHRKTVYTLAALAVGILCVVNIGYMLFANIGGFGKVLRYLAGILSPIIIGLVLAYVIDPIAKFFENHVFQRLKKEKLRRTLSAIIALVLVLAMVSLFIGTLIPSLIGSVSMLIANADVYDAGIEDFIEQINSLGHSFGFGLNIDLPSMVSSLKDYLTDFISNLAENLSSVLNTTKNIGNTLINVVIGVILAVYFLFGKQYLLTGLGRLRRALYTPETYENHNRFWRRCHDIFTQYIGCNLIDALIVGVSNAIFMLIIGMPYVSLISFAVGLTNLIPTFGPVIGAVIGAFVLVLVKPSYAMWFLIFTVAIQILDAYVIKPKLFSSSFGIPAVWTLIAITIGGKLFGILGVLLAIPFAAVIAFVYDERFIPWLQKKSRARAGLPEDGEKAPPPQEDKEEKKE